MSPYRTYDAATLRDWPACQRVSTHNAQRSSEARLSFLSNYIMSEQITSIFGGRRGRFLSPTLALAFFIGLAGIVAVFSFTTNDEGFSSLILGLVLLAIAGIGVSFAWAAGLLQFPGQDFAQ